jgi:transglutaminase/protease-like cytokinesis protein 3
MKKLILLFYCLLVAYSSVLAQDQPYNELYDEVDSYVDSLKIRTKKVPKIAQALTYQFVREEDKARAIYRWIANKIKYDCKEFHRSQLGKRRPKLQTVKKVLKRKKAVCGGYANLYKALATSAGLTCESISGFAKNSYDDIGRWQNSTNHAWNAVKINNKWQLLDVTWGSGYVDEDCKKFTRRFNEIYFLPNPEQLIVDHFPENPEWQLIAEKVEKKDFFNFPLPHSAFFLYDYKFLERSKGIIELAEDEYHNFDFKANFPIESANLYIENLYKYKIEIVNGVKKKMYESNWVNAETQAVDETNYACRFKLLNPSRYLTHIVLNGAPVLTYIVKVSKKKIPGRVDE